MNGVVGVWTASTTCGKCGVKALNDTGAADTRKPNTAFLSAGSGRRQAVRRRFPVLLEKSVAIIKHRAIRLQPSKTEKMAMQHQHGGLLEAEKTRLKPPPMYKVLLLNDDYTPMDFVVTVLQTVFVMSREKATQVMLQVHRDGVGVCGTFTREVAAAKVDQVTGLARQHQHPLQCTMEET
jgi:ATP-dependent Clp protease adaptor protein ClpS